ncbi:MAG: SUMF1/EgtB/PvdO family nonheme iron enzyme [Saprospiraceae bacterium]|nr:SUMF1/EgtB/PvdO family nonheme iron enzyme [Saprospiraceae bacterium]
MSGSNRVNRGGSWNNNPVNARCANRNNNTPDNRNNNLGFRLANTARNSRMPASKDAGSAYELSSRSSCILAPSAWDLIPTFTTSAW